MALTYKNNVIAAPANESNDIDMTVHITKIQITNADAADQVTTIKVGGSSGTTVWSARTPAGTTEQYDVNLRLKKSDTPNVTTKANTPAYIYVR